MRYTIIFILLAGVLGYIFCLRFLQENMEAVNLILDISGGVMILLTIASVIAFRHEHKNS